MFKKLEELGINPIGTLVFLLLAILFSVASYSPSLQSDIFDTLILLSPVWLPILLLFLGWHFWLTYIRAKYIASRKTLLLEVRLPREIRKSPLAMESVFNSLHFGPGEQTWIERYVKGKVRPWWSFELASIGGELHFFVWTTEFFRNVLEAAIYAQYPEVEIVEAKDYTRLVDFQPGKLSLWGADLILTGKDPIPIKTYVDYKLDKEGTKEEEKIDPLASVLEFLGSLKKDEQIWIQILAQQTKKKWREEGEEEIKKIRKESLEEAGSDDFKFRLDLTTEHQKIQMEAIARSIGKNGFDVGIRVIYMAQEGSFNPSNISGMLGTYKQFNSGNLNGFRPIRHLATFNYFWQKWFKRELRARRRVMDAYRRRSWFHGPYKTHPFILNTEELATIYHFPGSVVQTPTVARIPSRREEAPPNLPT